MKRPLTCSCLCEIAQPPIAVYACHCTDCQRITRSAFSIGMLVPGEAVHLLGAARTVERMVISNMMRSPTRGETLRRGLTATGQGRR
jgi:hypothetical protein